MLFFVYDIPQWLFGILTMAVCVIVGVGGLFVARPLVNRVLGPGAGANDIVSYFLSACGVFYGITLGLIAVGAWQSYSEVSGKVSREASALAALYNDVSSLPEPTGKELAAELRDYTRYVIDVAWPLHRRGEVPKVGTERLDAFRATLYAFEPASPGRAALHAEAIRKFNDLVELRRERLEAVDTGLPRALWRVVALGGILNICITWFFRVERVRLHATLVGITSALVGLLIFMTGAMDYPFRGEVSVGPDSFESVYEQSMRQHERK
ncbi:MAG: DUF4239 domain-containing protein [Phycisphaerae bacterium]|nr:DUF4239 domain-containing protein [Phycisphaerae bacterium]